MQYPICRHIKTNGLQCQSPALSGSESQWCFFHNRLHQRHSHYRYTENSKNRLIPGQHIELYPLEDAESIQVALSLVINALATGHLESKRATALLYGLQLASRNAAHLRPGPEAPRLVRSVDPSVDGLDRAQAGAMLEIDEPANERAKDEVPNGTPDPDLEETPAIRAISTNP